MLPDDGHHWLVLTFDVALLVLLVLMLMLVTTMR